jgi:hypothetical protein
LYIGGSVATWNGTVAASQNIASVLVPTQTSPVITWTLNHDTGLYNYYELPQATPSTPFSLTAAQLWPGKGYSLRMSLNYLVVGSPDSTPRTLQLWTKTLSPLPPFSWTWTAVDPCPPHRFGFSVAVDENLPPNHHIGGTRATIIAGEPDAKFTGRVWVYFSYSNAILQELFYGFGNETSTDVCFGESVSADSGFLAVGAPSLTQGSYTKAGAVFIYCWNNALGLQGLYQYVAEIVPPVPMNSGGFGESVSVWQNVLIVGDNMGNVYEYNISCSSNGTQIPLTDPIGANLITRLGYTVSVWDRLVAAGDEEFVNTPQDKGTTFVWTRNPLPPPMYDLTYQFSDGGAYFNSRFGANVDVRGGCYVVSGATNVPPFGGVYVDNLCNEGCYGCDGILNSCLYNDACGVCNGDNSTCKDCFGVINGPAVLDVCGVCGGSNNTCLIPYSVPSSINIPCNGSLLVYLDYAFQYTFGPVNWVIIPPYPTKAAVAVVQHSGSTTAPFPDLFYQGAFFQSGSDTVHLNASTVNTPIIWGTLAIPVTIGTCYDCNGTLGGPNRPDACGVCNGNNSTCKGCDGVVNSGKVIDYCGICGGNNSTCLNLTIQTNQTVNCTAEVVFKLTYQPSGTPVIWNITAGPILGTAYINPVAGDLVFFNPAISGLDWVVVRATSKLNSSVWAQENITFTILNCTDCSGTLAGLQIYDLCGVCGGNGLSCADCLGIPNGGAVVDVCGVCDGLNNTCLDCAGIPNGGEVIDPCGVCGGDGSSCSAGAGLWPWFIIISLLIILFVGIGYIIYYLIVHFTALVEIENDNDLRKTKHPANQMLREHRERTAANPFYVRLEGKMVGKRLRIPMDSMGDDKYK